MSKTRIGGTNCWLELRLEVKHPTSKTGIRRIVKETLEKSPEVEKVGIKVVDWY